MELLIVGIIIGIIIGWLLCRGAAGTGPRYRGGHSPNVPPVDWTKVKPPPVGSAARPPTRAVRPGEAGGHTPDIPPVDWSRVDTRGIRSAVQPPPTGIIPGRPGQEINSGGYWPWWPYRSDSPRPEDR